jgi:DNA-directed RNA polymerase subunit RPC12/RpoP
MITEEQKDKMLAKGKRLMTVERWQEFAYCPDCNHRKCSHCIRETIARADISHFLNAMQGGDLVLFFEDYPPQLHDQVIRCSFCGSRRHITEWLQVSFWPELYDIPEIEEAILKASRDTRAMETEESK